MYRSTPFPDTIKIGSGADYCRVVEHNGCAIFRKTLPSGKLPWVIARRPKKVAPSDPPPPASVAAEFETEQSAIQALDRWATKPSSSKHQTPDQLLLNLQ